MGMGMGRYCFSGLFMDPTTAFIRLTLLNIMSGLGALTMISVLDVADPDSADWCVACVPPPLATRARATGVCHGQRAACTTPTCHVYRMNKCVRTG